MTITANTQLLFPTASQSGSPLKASSGIEPQHLNTPVFAQVLKQQTPSTYPPSETRTFTRGAKATEVQDRILDTTAKEPPPTDSACPSIRSTKTNELYDWLIEVGTAEPEWADRWAYLYGCEDRYSPLIYVGDWPIIRIAATGEILTQEKLDYFKKVADLYHDGRVNLYETELAKGTPPLEILKKIFEYNDTLPEEYRKMEGWH